MDCCNYCREIKKHSTMKKWWLYLLLRLNTGIFKGSSKNRTRNLDLRKNRPLKNGTVGKIGPQGLNMLLFVSSHMKDNAEVIHFHIKNRGVKGHILVQIMFEKCTTNFLFWNVEVGIKTTIANLSYLFVGNVSACLRAFMHPCFE